MDAKMQDEVEKPPRNLGGRPRTHSIQIILSIRPGLVAALDEWRYLRRPLPNRQEAIRRLVWQALSHPLAYVPPSRRGRRLDREAVP